VPTPRTVVVAQVPPAGGLRRRIFVSEDGASSPLATRAGRHSLNHAAGGPRTRRLGWETPGRVARLLHTRRAGFLRREESVCADKPVTPEDLRSAGHAQH
jgi:hypothetical protein